MVVPYCYHRAPGAQPAILTIANAYTARVGGRLAEVTAREASPVSCRASGPGAHGVRALPGSPAREPVLAAIPTAARAIRPQPPIASP